MSRVKKQQWTETKLRDLFPNCSDVHVHLCRLHSNADSEVVLLYAEGLCDTSQISKVILPELSELYKANGFVDLEKGIKSGSLLWEAIDGGESEKKMSEWVFEGDLMLLLPSSGLLFKVNICNRPQRTPEESSSEISIKGPKDGFVEDIIINVALIRKRIRSSSLRYETYTIGRRTQTKVGLLYFHDILSPTILSQVQARINKIDIDGLYSINQLEEMLSDNKNSFLPMFATTGRPDYVLSSLLAGRFVIIIDGNPMVLIGPGTLSLLLKSPEDIHFNYLYVSFARIIRSLSLFLSIILPGFWVALMAFHQDQVPFRFLATISVAREGLPMSIQLEMLILLMLLEIFREAGVRLPSSIGQTLTTVGGLIIGDAAIRAGLVSPSIVVIGAVTAVTAVTLVNQSLSTVISVIRLAIFLCGSILGMYGVILGMILLVAYLSRLKSFGVPYLAPLSPPNKDFFNSYLRLPWNKGTKRSQALHPVDPDHQEEDTR